MQNDLGPDVDITMPVREARAALAIIEHLHAVLSQKSALADEIACALPPLNADAELPEIGKLRDGEHVRLHLRRLAERMREHVPTADPPMDPITDAPPRNA